MKLFLLLLFCLAQGAWANDLFLVQIKAKDVNERSQIARTAHIDMVKDDRVWTTVNMADLKVLKDQISDKILSIEIYNEFHNFLDNPELSLGYEFPEGEEKYHTFDEIVAEFSDLKIDYPNKTEVFSIGKSVENRDIWALRITNDITNTEIEKPAIVFMGTHHAREHLSTEMPLIFANKILADSLTDIDLTNLLDEIEIYIIPMVNPDGALFDITNRQYQMWRKNRKKNQGGSFGVDLNRNYSYGWGTGGSSTNPRSDVYMGTAPFSEPETSAIRDFFLAHKNITIALSFHSFSELILYPWGGKEEGIGGEDEAVFKTMAQDMANMNHYRPMQSSELYIASGDTCDWAYGEFKIFCFTFELSPSSIWEGGFYPDIDLIEKAFLDNYAPMIYLAKRAKNPKMVLDF